MKSKLITYEQFEAHREWRDFRRRYPELVGYFEAWYRSQLERARREEGRDGNPKNARR